MKLETAKKELKKSRQLFEKINILNFTFVSLLFVLFSFSGRFFTLFFKFLFDIEHLCLMRFDADHHHADVTSKDLPKKNGKFVEK